MSTKTRFSAKPGNEHNQSTMKIICQLTLNHLSKTTQPMSLSSHINSLCDLALAQSDIFLSKLGVVRQDVDHTAGAAQLVASTGLRDAGVVASARAAEFYGLNILAEGIQDDSAIITRYLVLARDPSFQELISPLRRALYSLCKKGL